MSDEVIAETFICKKKSSKMINNVKCFECGDHATEQHHVIPKVMGGTKTIPLCSRCHMKVHGLDGTKRADNHKETVKRGLDKIRVWELFAVYNIVKINEIHELNVIQKKLDEDFDYNVSLEKTKRLYNRLEESDDHYLQILFDEHLDPSLSVVWNQKDREFKDGLIHKKILENLDLLKKVDGEEQLRLIKKINKSVDDEFLQYKNNSASSSS